MSVSSLLARAALTVGLLGTAAAQADTIALTPEASGTLAGSFRHAADGLFIDTYDFSPTTFTGLVSVTLFAKSGPVSFFTATLNGTDFSYFPESGAVDFSFQADVTADTPLSLTVFGAVLDADGNVGGTGLYAGTVLAAVAPAVPEVQNWALLLAGLGLTGAAVRSRRRGLSDVALPAA